MGRASLAGVRVVLLLADAKDTFEGEIGVEVLNFGHFTGDEGGISAGGMNDGRRGQFPREREQDFTNEAAVADDGSDLHGVLG